MKPSTAKYVLAGCTALVGALGDVALQLQQGALTNASRPVVIGLVMAVAVRVIGKVLEQVVTRAAQAAPAEEP